MSGERPGSPENTIEYYMSLPYVVEIKHDEDGWFARLPELPGAMTWAESFEGLGTMIEGREAGLDRGCS